MKALPLISLLAFTACSSATPFVASGEGIKSAGEDFVICAQLMDQALTSKTITPDQYNEWKAFGQKFQLSFPIAVQLWKSARIANDAILEQRALVILMTLASELAKFYEPVKELVLSSLAAATVDGGAP